VALVRLALLHNAIARELTEFGPQGVSIRRSAENRRYERLTTHPQRSASITKALRSRDEALRKLCKDSGSHVKTFVGRSIDAIAANNSENLNLCIIVQSAQITKALQDLRKQSNLETSPNLLGREVVKEPFRNRCTSSES
jgi:hypothetical protein